MVTYHSIIRASERTRYNGKTAVRFIENGIARGKTAADFTKRERNYLANCAKGNCTAKAYNGFCLIIGENGDCITLFRLPEWFGKKHHNSSKKAIRDTEQYTESLGGICDMMPA